MPPRGSAKKSAGRERARGKKEAVRGETARLKAESLVQRGEELLAVESFGEGLDMLREAARLAPGDAAVHEALGAAAAEYGDPREAVAALQAAAALAPGEGHAKFMYLAQLLDGPGALEAARAGVAVLERDAARAGERANEAREVLPGALCTLAEVLLGGCGVESAGCAEEAEGALRRAGELSGGLDPEPLQALASLRVEQDRPAEALELIRRSVSLWLPGYREQLEEAAAARGAVKAAGSAAAGATAAETPSVEARVEAAKLLLELEESTSPAVRVLEGVVRENDGVPDVWYLLALALHAGGRLTRAEEALERGEALLAALGAEGAGEGAMAEFAELRSAIEESQRALEAAGEEEAPSED
eukprot:CAMPEP_0183801066 /NCGR_PEP_ID=MMETSP0803_2-20130417/26740_1 /TAXON_ID=195967 /ORGANISM="Crustomastix stigmata, Strain CCMP3273" /LENGTH=360 /DNA_ID=CAMNT_0026045785 /DNA_START=1 /DNA_END=1080 /DNA_ORIENTATION=+